MNLNIIGNGFDLFNGLPSSYYYFGCYLIKNDYEFYEHICSMYDLKYMKMIEPAIAHDFEYVVEDIFWSDFEKHLGSVSENFIIDKYPDELYLENSDPVELEMNDDKASEVIIDKFTKWVSHTLDLEENFRIIESYSNRSNSRLNFDKNDYFVQFNYTHTLQKIYRVNDLKIHYIHGECGEEDLIVGHGEQKRLSEIEIKIDSLEDEYDYTQESSNRINEYKCLYRYIDNVKKDVDIHRLGAKRFYSQIRNIDKVIVFGHSLGEVDLPYFQDIRNKWPEAKWEVSYYSCKEIERITQVLEESLKLKNNEYELFEFKDDISKEIKEEIILSIGIDTFDIVDV
jgi:hypothetical protein